jgi:hypothetical protein
LEFLCDYIEIERLCWILLGLSNVFSGEFYFIHQIRPFCMISIFFINTKIDFFILLFDEFYVFRKWNKSLFKILQKNHFRYLDSLCDDMKILWICCILLGLSNFSIGKFYFIHQIRSFCMISVFIINTKINFCILFFNEFYVFGKWNKSLFKILQKNYFRNLEPLCDDI